MDLKLVTLSQVEVEAFSADGFPTAQTMRRWAEALAPDEGKPVAVGLMRDAELVGVLLGYNCQAIARCVALQVQAGEDVELATYQLATAFDHLAGHRTLKDCATKRAAAGHPVTSALEVLGAPPTPVPGELVSW